ncbi:hypothetical protein E8E15_002426 [Penicillium rubens]|nr:hypothetical protein E8E15_002426 [Penicillium rubens]
MTSPRSWFDRGPSRGHYDPGSIITTDDGTQREVFERLKQDEVQRVAQSRISPSHATLKLRCVKANANPRPLKLCSWEISSTIGIWPSPPSPHNLVWNDTTETLFWVEFRTFSRKKNKRWHEGWLPTWDLVKTPNNRWAHIDWDGDTTGWEY